MSLVVPYLYPCLHIQLIALFVQQTLTSRVLDTFLNISISNLAQKDKDGKKTSDNTGNPSQETLSIMFVYDSENEVVIQVLNFNAADSIHLALILLKPH